ncbi:uncharacterized protein PV09_08257 [Verruconis gallopava]|uniref:FAD-binding domain-containing protein n=1 Tax=Verruconis gallopava TaxID=253628 RepID=A0A0D1YHA7_9PEZI|nr:uncharacterized protein PV09_08257 [Verruconis gallopava]KIW00217.1 hypothetical protein PV09_08257 [Verruconis gallopava]
MSIDDQPISVVIIGAGIGGLALAIGLLKQNVKFTVYEAAPKFDAVGAGIGLGPNALRAMELMDPTFASKYNKVKVGNTTPERKNEQFEILGTQEGFGITDEWTGGSVSHPKFERSSAHRKALLAIMESLIPDGTVKFNKRVRDIKQDHLQDKVRIDFEDNTFVEADVVIGCDGIKGLSRKAVLESRWPEEVAAKYVHTYVYRGIAPMEEAKKRVGVFGQDAKWWMGPRKGWTMYPISGGTEVNIVCFMYDENAWEGAQVTREVTREEMEAEFENFDGRLKSMLEFVKPIKWPLFHHPDTPTYYNGHICLLGDSAHASSPSQAAGAGQGLEDALILSRLLGLVRSKDQISIALEIYDSIRRPRAQGVVRESAQVGRAYYLIDPKFGDDLVKITEDANRRLPLIWWHDLDGDVKRAEDTFREKVSESKKSQIVAVSVIETPSVEPPLAAHTIAV